MSRIILKISGEALKDDTQNISNNKLDIVLKTVQYLRKNNHFCIKNGTFLPLIL